MWRVREWLAWFVPRHWRYSRKWARHVLGDLPQAPRDFYGSMDLDSELDWQARVGFLPAPPELAHDWREQTAADLAPETLDQEVMPTEELAAPTEVHLRAVSGAHVSPGPGGSFSLGVSVPPGPDRDGGGRGDPGSEPFVAAAVPPDLGPNAARVLERYERRFHERWGCRLDAAAA